MGKSKKMPQNFLKKQANWKMQLNNCMNASIQYFRMKDWSQSNEKVSFVNAISLMHQ